MTAQQQDQPPTTSTPGAIKEARKEDERTTSVTGDPKLPEAPGGAGFEPEKSPMAHTTEGPQPPRSGAVDEPGAPT